MRVLFKLDREKRNLLEQFCTLFSANERFEPYGANLSFFRARTDQVLDRHEAQIHVALSDASKEGKLFSIRPGTRARITEKLKEIGIEGSKILGSLGEHGGSRPQFSLVFPIDGEVGDGNIKVLEQYIREKVRPVQEVAISEERAGVRAQEPAVPVDEREVKLVISELSTSGLLRKGITPRELSHAARHIISSLNVAARER